MAEKLVKSLCGFCHVNCGIKVLVQDGKVTRIEGDPDNPVNRGYICPKAQAIKPMLESEERLKFPLKKTAGGFVKISWDEALDLAGEKLAKIKQAYGPESLFGLQTRSIPPVILNMQPSMVFSGLFQRSGKDRTRLLAQKNGIQRCGHDGW